MKIHMLTEKIEMTQPGDANRWYRPGRRRAWLTLRIPVWAASLLNRCGVIA